jgi:hypothetical protein
MQVRNEVKAAMATAAELRGWADLADKRGAILEKIRYTDAADRIEQFKAALREAREDINIYGLDAFESTTHEILAKIDAALKD